MTIYDPKKKFQLRVDKNIEHKIPDDIVELLRRNAYKYTNTKAKESVYNNSNLFLE